MAINNEKFNQLYSYIRQDLIKSIENQTYPPNSELPSTRELSNLYLVNEDLVLSVIESLITEGFLIKVNSSFFVLDIRYQETLTSKGITLNLNSMNNEEHIQFNELRKYIRRAGCLYSMVLNIQPEDDIYYIERLVKRNDTPLWYEENYCAVNLLPNLSHIDTTVYSLESILTYHNIPIGGQQQIVEVVPGTKRLKKILRLEPNKPVLRFNIYILDLYGNNQFHIKRYYHPNAISFNLEN
ncbi:UTRA domain-containing protein [Facklamia languida]|uniref:HTH gntR-type domain-containing protein n=1 Tax=Facklamia languida CCUG 37842 TaxID=883113 RepID=H3NIG5_9LACT|nr:GntR family transcriptional regulator [Facklamia languida]EHR37475.1 hypothetical protein HMPREF9708_00654 [Facklamia languida CCUG 37842]